MRFALYVLVLFAWVCADHKSYDGWKVFRMVARNDQDCKILIGLATNPSVDFWSNVIINKFIDVMVNKDYQDRFRSLMEENRIEYTILIDDLESVLREERMQNVLALQSRHSKPEVEQFHTLDEFYQQIERDMMMNLDNILQISRIGLTRGERPIYIYKLSLNHKKKKPILFIEAGMHGRELVGPIAAKACLYLFRRNQPYRSLLNKVDWHIICVSNPDGHLYARDVDQLWRKNRSPQPNSNCIGVDINRNFGYKWGQRGSTGDPCSPTYMGPSAFSENETTAISGYIMSLKDRIKMYISLHGYGSLVLLPWADRCTKPDNYDELRSVAEAFNRTAVNLGSEPYDIGSFANIKYYASGVSVDWVMAEAKVPFTYTILLPKGRTTNLNPSDDQMKKIGAVTAKAICEFGKFVAQKFG